MATISSTFTRGRNVKVKYRQNGIPVIAVFKSVVIEEMAQEVADDVNGEQRSRFDIVVDGYKVSLDGFVPNFDLLDSFLQDTINDDASNAPFSKFVQFTTQLRDGSVRAYRASGLNAARSPWKFNAGDRKGTNMLTISYRFPWLSLVNV